MMKKFFTFLLLCLFLMSLFMLPVFAEGEVALPEDFSAIPDILGDENKKLLPDGIFSDKTSDVGEAISQMTELGFWIELLERLLGRGIKYCASLFLKLSVLVLLSAIFGALGKSMSSEALSNAVRFCSSALIFTVMIDGGRELLSEVELYFERLTALMEIMIPITGSVWAMGGNITTGAAGTGTLYVFLTVCQGLCAKSIIPVSCVLTVLALLCSLSPEMGLVSLTNALKKIYTFFLGMVMTLLLASLGTSTTLCAAADSTSARAAKLISSNVIPFVGASIGDTLRTIATSVGYIKSIVGIGGIIFILLLLVPVLVSLIMTRLAFLLASGLAEMMGCETECKLLTELSGVYAIITAVATICGVMFIFALTIFAKSTVALM